MFKDYHKYLSASLKVYLFVLVIIFIMKLIGMNYFNIDINNPIIINIDLFMSNFIVQNIIYFILIMIYQHIMITLIRNQNVNKITIISIPFTFVFQYFVKRRLMVYNLNFIGELLYLFTICLFYKKFSKQDFKRYIIVMIANIILQLISFTTRYTYSLEYITSPSINLILNLDYLLMMMILYKIYQLKGDILTWTEFLVEVGSSLQKKMNLKKLLTKLQRNYHSFKTKDKETKLTIVIYLLLSLIWNVATIITVLIVAQLNHTFIECIFILTSFWISKRTFGKAFHLNSMIQCFVVSNLTYYILNRITTPLGISIFVPILLGVGLSYFTSKLVKKTYKPLYKGISKEMFEETILKVVDKDSMKYKICYDFYIEGKSDLSLSFKYNYSIAGIRKIRTRINGKIKELV